MTDICEEAGIAGIFIQNSIVKGLEPNVNQETVLVCIYELPLKYIHEVPDGSGTGDVEYTGVPVAVSTLL
jgi:hypothetical protein